MWKTFLAFPLLVYYGIEGQMAPSYQKTNDEKYPISTTEKPPAEKPNGYRNDEDPPPPPPPILPGDAYASQCKYEDVPFTDCDPFHLVKWRQMKLLLGGSHCESYKNETERCSSEDFPPGSSD